MLCRPPTPDQVLAQLRTAATFHFTRGDCGFHMGSWELVEPEMGTMSLHRGGGGKRALCLRLLPLGPTPLAYMQPPATRTADSEPGSAEIVARTALIATNNQTDYKFTNRLTFRPQFGGRRGGDV